jgi:glycosyltransferase involved in cell wall biosynthesis
MPGRGEGRVIRETVAYRTIARALPLPLKQRMKALLIRTRDAMAAPPERLGAYRTRPIPGLLSFVTTVWNTDPAYVQELANSVFAQDFGTEFEWFILDNGCTRPDTIATLASVARHSCVRLHRVEQNLGIIGGMRYCLEHARNRYVLPLDSDDLLTPDCARIFTAVIRDAGFPALLYSDEDKLEHGAHCEPYFKPDWDPVLFVHSCYIAHLCAIDRVRALELDAYTDKVAEGSHDWDSFMRFLLAGHTPVHVPEVVYSWRKHPQSTAQNIHSKPVVFESQSRVVGRFVAKAARPYLYCLEKSPLFGGMPDWRIRRLPGETPQVTTLLLHDGDAPRASTVPAAGYPGHTVVPVTLAAGLAGLRRAIAGRSGLVHLLWDQVELRDPEWAWEALAMFELFPDTVMVGGRIEDEGGSILAAGACFGFGRGCDMPDRGRAAADPGYFAQMWKQRSVSAVSSQHAVCDAAFLTDVLNHAPGASIAHLGAWAGAAARRQGGRVIYSPFLHGRTSQDWQARVPDAEHAAFAAANADLLPETTLISRHLGLDAGSAYRPVAQAARTQHLATLHADRRLSP